jgi:hypothetical protein
MCGAMVALGTLGVLALMANAPKRLEQPNQWQKYRGAMRLREERERGNVVELMRRVREAK